MPLSGSAPFDMPRNTSVPDTRLVRRSQQGDRRAFRALLTRHDWRLRGLAHALLLDAGQVDAVLRVAYIRAWREVVRIDPREDAAAWLYRVVYNACIDGLRRESTGLGAAPPAGQGVADAVNPGDEAADPPVEPTPVGGNGDRPTATDGRQALVVEALTALAPADRVVVVLVDREGFGPEAAGRILGLTPDVVQARLDRARARLANQLADVLAPPAAPADEAAPDAEALAETEGPAEAEAEAEAQTEAETGAQTEAETEAQAEAESEVQTEAESEVQTEAETRAQTEAPSDEPQATSKEPHAELDDTASADPADMKVASRSAAGGSSNGSGAASSNGSDDGGGGAS
jgi:RNA polymerase sigma factor (sigma-70 family)